MSILIKGMEMPKEGGIIVIYKEGNSFYTTIAGEGRRYPLVPVPPHGRLIDADVLYKQTAEWEAKALAQLGKSDKRGWAFWNAVLVERTAFKHDVMGTPIIIEAEEGEDE